MVKGGTEPGSLSRGACAVASVTPHFWTFRADGERKGKRASSYLEWFRGFGSSPDWTTDPPGQELAHAQANQEQRKGNSG